jgi:threonine dehydrogenase-like Zn-dependent dehydrogenase
MSEILAIAARPRSVKPTFVAPPRVGEPRDGKVLCRTLELGVCGTDREILLSGEPLVPPGEDHLILGHECLARVEAVAPSVLLRVGDLVVPVVRRPRTPPAARVDMDAFATFTERGIMFEHGFSMPRWLDRPEYLVPVDPAIADVAVLTEPLAVAEKGANEATVIQRARLGDDVWRTTTPRVLVTGMGPIGFAAVLASVARGWPVTIYGRDRRDSFRSQLAERLGATYLPADEATVPDDVERGGFDLALECTGSDEVMLWASQMLAARGVMAWLGSARVPRPTTANVERLMRDGLLRNHVYLGCVNAAPRDFRDAVAHLAVLYRRQPEDVNALITDRVRPAEALAYYESRKPQGIKAVVMYA